MRRFHIPACPGQSFFSIGLTSIPPPKIVWVIPSARFAGWAAHVFAFIDGTRPSDDLIKASLPDAGAPDSETSSDENDLEKKTPAKVETQSRTAKNLASKAKPKRRR